MSRLVIFLKEQESSALLTLAASQFRDPRAQVALIIRLELERRGLLQSPPVSIREGTGNQNHKDPERNVGYDER